ncbi:heparinase II/III family protein [Gemmatimonadota bacterium]
MRHTYFLDALPLATGVDLYKKPFYRNNGYFPVYFHPPYAKRGAFGDGGYRAPNVNEKLLLQKYALATGNPIFLWHAEQINTGDQTAQRIKNDAGEINWRPWAMEDVAEVLGAAPAGLKSKPPTGLPGSRFLKDIGWVAAHSELGSAENDVWVVFKSSRYGSLSHSHADQNSFILNAYGEPLLIDSGYYPWYGSPHHCLWTRRTRAHNAVLVNGRGQGNFSMAARGKIEQYSHTGKLTYLRAEAGSAYNVPLSDGTLELWKEHLSGPTPSMEPKVLAARRSLAFSADKQHPWLAVHDYLETDSPASFDYLLHSQEKMELEQDAATVLVKQGAARVKVFILSDNDLVFSQDDEFSPPPGNRYEGAPNQWHFSARTKNEANRVKFLALYVPYREGEAPPSVELVAAGAARGFKVAGEQVLTWWGDSETGDLAGYGPGRLFLELKEAEGLKRYAKD